jgi:hypothetical protein
LSGLRSSASPSATVTWSKRVETLWKTIETFWKHFALPCATLDPFKTLAWRVARVASAGTRGVESGAQARG